MEDLFPIIRFLIKGDITEPIPEEVYTEAEKLGVYLPGVPTSSSKQVAPKITNNRSLYVTKIAIGHGDCESVDEKVLQNVKNSLMAYQRNLIMVSSADPSVGIAVFAFRLPEREGDLEVQSNILNLMNTTKGKYKTATANFMNSKRTNTNIANVEAHT